MPLGLDAGVPGWAPYPGTADGIDYRTRRYRTGAGENDLQLFILAVGSIFGPAIEARLAKALERVTEAQLRMRETTSWF